MSAPMIDNLMVLKTVRFETPLMLGVEGDGPIACLADLNRMHLYLGLPEGQEARGRVHLDQSRQAVRQALNEAIRIARAIETASAVAGTPAAQEAVIEAIRDFSTRYGPLWGVTVPDPLPRGLVDRRVPGSMLDWYRELLTLLDMYELLPTASGKREDRTLRNRVSTEHDSQVAVFTCRTGERIPLATKDQKIIVQPPWEAKPRLVEPWELVHSGSVNLAWVILIQVCKSRLDGHVNIGLNPAVRNSLAITPSGIGPTLFARLLRDALHRETDLGVARRCARPDCESYLPADARFDRRYCSNTCQRADRRRLQRLERART